MHRNLIDLSTKELLEKFGAGNHKPGSGSAAALQGLLSAQLIRTVISLTNEESRREKYREWLPKLLDIDTKVGNRVYVKLLRLFQEDSDIFEKTIKLRKERDKETNSRKKKVLTDRALQELKLATEMPIEIAKLCVELAEFAMPVFDYGFKSARGDSGVALNGAISAIAGCLSIVDLNLLSFHKDEWTDKIRQKSGLLRERHRVLYREAEIRQNILKEETDQKNAFYSELNTLLSSIPHESRISDLDIEEIAANLQNTIWKYRAGIWKKNIPENPIHSLDPEIALKKLGYQFQLRETLGQDTLEGTIVEIAGLIDNKYKIVGISRRFPIETQNFTAAHELGHALLHKQQILHRDRPIDGSSISRFRTLQERQADKFAACFLMPRKQVREVFQSLFLTEKFLINDETAFHFNVRPSDLRKKCKNLRGLARLLASTEYFGGSVFESISKQFGVSDGAMAIRLEELNLIEF